MSKKIKIVFITISVIFFLVSLMSDCYIANGKEDTIGSFGLGAFLLGWMNASESFVSWLANPFHIISIILLFFNQKASLVCASISFTFALSFQFFDEVLINEAGTIGNINSLGIGYWLWLTSITIIFVTSILNYKKT